MARGVADLVKALEAEGIEAGQRQAKQIIQAARDDARQITDQARQQARQILGNAEKHSAEIRSRAEVELTLATRDAVLRLRETLIAGISDLLRQDVEQELEDTDFLRQLIEDLVRQYVRADAEGRVGIELNLRRDAGQKLRDWAIRTIQHQMNGGPGFELHDNLAEAGFEYRVSDGTVEVTVDSVTDVLGQMLAAELRQRMDQAFAGDDARAGDASPADESSPGEPAPRRRVYAEG